MTRATAKPLMWAAFLGCSWTWCIGMFLPVLIVRETGIWGWVTFAAPNVIGAAAMGWMLARPGTSERVVSRHGPACLAFSTVTIAFHIFFLLWFVPRLAGLPPAAMALGMAAVYLIASVQRPQWDAPAAAVVWAFSLAMAGWFLVNRSAHIAMPSQSSGTAFGAAWLAPACVFGFLLCPYLDLTFHRARQATTAPEAKLAFGLGFGICFLLMIVFTLLYVATLIPLLSAVWREHERTLIGRIIAAHMIAQSALTIALHARSFVAAQTRRGPVLLLFAAAQIALLLGLAANVLPRYRGLDGGEMIYRMFMGFYGLIFPAYVWHFMVPGRDGRTRNPSVATRTMLLGVILAAPMFWMGFVQDHLVWLAPAVAVIVLTRFLDRRTAATHPAPSGTPAILVDPVGKAT